MTTTVRIRPETRETLRDLQARTGENPQELLARAVDQFRRSLILAETNVAYGRLRGAVAAEIQAEDDDWDATAGDGIEDE